MEVKRRSVRAQLTAVHDWPARALRAKYFVDELARDCGASVRSLEYFFLERFRIPPKRILKMWRQAEAERRLDAKERPDGIWSPLGYTNLAHFCNSFRKATGLTPTRWRFRHLLRKPVLVHRHGGVELPAR